MRLILRVLLSALAVVILAKVLPHVSVDTYFTAIIVAIVLSLLNFLVKPILVILTLPVTIVTSRVVFACHQRTHHLIGRQTYRRVRGRRNMVGPAL